MKKGRTDESMYQGRSECTMDIAGNKNGIQIQMPGSHYLSLPLEHLRPTFCSILSGLEGLLGPILYTGCFEVRGKRNGESLKAEITADGVRSNHMAETCHLLC